MRNYKNEYILQFEIFAKWYIWGNKRMTKIEKILKMYILSIQNIENAIKIGKKIKIFLLWNLKYPKYEKIKDWVIVVLTVYQMGYLTPKIFFVNNVVGSICYFLSAIICGIEQPSSRKIREKYIILKIRAERNVKEL